MGGGELMFKKKLSHRNKLRIYRVTYTLLGVVAIIVFASSIFCGYTLSVAWKTNNFNPDLDQFRGVVWIATFIIFVGTPFAFGLIFGLMAILQYTFYLEERIKKLET